MGATNPWKEAQELRDFKHLPVEDQITELWIVTRETRDAVQSLKTLVTGSSVNAWLMRLRNALSWITPIAALMLAAWVGFH